jgi:hypothetical protein
VLGPAARLRLVQQHARGLGLPDAFARVGLDGLCGRKSGWLAFRHGKDEYGIDSASAKVAGWSPGISAVDPPGGVPEGHIHMEEREFFNETTEQRTHNLTCPKCGQAAEYRVTWIVRRKRAQVPRGADERDRARFAKAQSYMVRRDDKLQCANMRCRKPFEITTLQSLAFLME